MNYKNAITMTTLSVIAVFAITSITLIEIPETNAAQVAQPTKYVWSENVTPTVSFDFRDGSEMTAVQSFIQTGGFSTITFDTVDKTKAKQDAQRSLTSKPAFTIEKIAGATPYLYEAADEAQKYQLNAGFEFQAKYFNAKVFLTDANGKDFRTFDYTNCRVTGYNVSTRSDNEEGYFGKGFAVVEQYAFECNGYTPNNPVMDKMDVKESAKTIGTSDLKSTDKWEPGFTTQK